MTNTGNPAITPEERAQALQWMDESRTKFLDAIADLTPEQWTWAPEQGHWSIGQAAEHVVLAEALLFGAVQLALATARNDNWQTETEGKDHLLARVLPGTGKAVAPDPIVPRHGLTQEEVRGRFEQQREGILRFTHDTTAPLREHTRLHPMPIFGTLNAWQWLLYVPLHTIRHTNQILGIRKRVGFPGESTR